MTDEKRTKLLAASFAQVPGEAMNFTQFGTYGFEVDKYGVDDLKTYRDIIKLSRFFYRHDPICSTVVNKLIDIAVTDIEFFKGKLSDNELRLFEGVEDDIHAFLESCALEFLITGMVVPEIKFAPVPKKVLTRWGVKKMNTATVPIDMWVRDSGTIIVQKPFLSGKSSYYVQVPDEVIFFIQSKGQYPDGNSDPVLYAELLAYYPAFVTLVEEGKTEIKLEPEIVLERRKMADSTYSIPYTYASLESLKHKRNLRKMDYSIASRVITAIQLIQLGNDMYPLTADDSDQLEEIRQQIYWRNSTGVDIERVFQLFGNHTLQISWVFPETTALLDDKKYITVNNDIMIGFGFPSILTTGEVERSGTSNPEFAILSPLKTMENLREKLMLLLDIIVQNMVELNGLSNEPEYDFAPMNLHDFTKFFEALSKLYETGNISRDSFVEPFGFNVETELQKRKEEQDLIKKLGLEEFSPLPHSNAPVTPGKPAPAKPATQVNKPAPKQAGEE